MMMMQPMVRTPGHRMLRATLRAPLEALSDTRSRLNGQPGAALPALEALQQALLPALRLRQPVELQNKQD
jgi:hypothetical protein